MVLVAGAPSRGRRSEFVRRGVPSVNIGSGTNERSARCIDRYRAQYLQDQLQCFPQSQGDSGVTTPSEGCQIGYSQGFVVIWVRGAASPSVFHAMGLQSITALSADERRNTSPYYPSPTPPAHLLMHPCMVTACSTTKWSPLRSPKPAVPPSNQLSAFAHQKSRRPAPTATQTPSMPISAAFECARSPPVSSKTYCARPRFGDVLAKVLPATRCRRNGRSLQRT